MGPEEACCTEVRSGIHHGEYRLATDEHSVNLDRVVKTHPRSPSHTFKTARRRSIYMEKSPLGRYSAVPRPCISISELSFCSPQ